MPPGELAEEGKGHPAVCVHLGDTAKAQRYLEKSLAVREELGKQDLANTQFRRDVGVSYTVKKWTTRVQLAAERPVGAEPRIADSGESVAVDFGGSYSLNRNIAVTAGVRYKSERNNRLEALQDNRRDSQAVYLGTAFRF
jgi:hypothetical protein